MKMLRRDAVDVPEFFNVNDKVQLPPVLVQYPEIISTDSNLVYWEDIPLIQYDTATAMVIATAVRITVAITGLMPLFYLDLALFTSTTGILASPTSNLFQRIIKGYRTGNPCSESIKYRAHGLFQR